MSNSRKELEHLIGLTLRLFKGEAIDEEYSIRKVMDVYSDSRVFNWWSFMIGMYAGSLLVSIIKIIIKMIWPESGN